MDHIFCQMVCSSGSTADVLLLDSVLEQLVTAPFGCICEGGFYALQQLPSVSVAG